MTQLPRLLFHEMTREDLRAAAPQTLLVLPVGATEQHGPHLPVGTDWLTVERIARSAAGEIAGRVPIVVAPTLPFGSSSHHIPFGGTLSITTETYYRVICELLETLIAGGFRSLFVLNGHGGNHELVQLAARDLALKHRVGIAAASYWTIAWEALVAAGAHEAGRLPGHAGSFETALILAQRPELVREPRPHRDQFARSDPRTWQTPYRAELSGSWQRIDGYSDSPDQGKAEHGQQYLDLIVKAVAHAFSQFYESTGDLRRQE